MLHPRAVFRHPAKLVEARSQLAEQQKIFKELFGTDLIVVRGSEVPEKTEAFYRRHSEVVRPGQPSYAPVQEFPDDVLGAESCTIYFADEGLSFWPNYHLLDELFANPALITRRRHHETLSASLRDPELSPEARRRLAQRDRAKATKVFTGLLKHKRGFSWNADGEELLRRSKPGYFSGTVLPRTMPLSKLLSDAYMHAHTEIP